MRVTESSAAWVGVYCAARLVNHLRFVFFRVFCKLGNASFYDNKLNTAAVSLDDNFGAELAKIRFLLLFSSFLAIFSQPVAPKYTEENSLISLSLP